MKTGQQILEPPCLFLFVHGVNSNLAQSLSPLKVWMLPSFCQPFHCHRKIVRCAQVYQKEIKNLPIVVLALDSNHFDRLDHLSFESSPLPTSFPVQLQMFWLKKRWHIHLLLFLSVYFFLSMNIFLFQFLSC